MDLATAAVGLIILFDITTGQGPPGLNSYLGPPPPREYLAPPPQVIQTIGYMPRGEYDAKRPDKSLDEKDEYENVKEKDDKYLVKSYEKDNNKDYDKSYKSTPAPGVFASFSNSMSDAWKSLTTLGRQSRSIPQTKTDHPNADSDTIIIQKRTI